MADGRSTADLWDRRVETEPDRVAVEGDSSTWTVAELDARSSAVAEAVAVRSPEDPVAVIGRASPDGLAAVLGVLRAGAAYSFVDHDLPAARRDLILGLLGDGPVLVAPDAGEIGGIDAARLLAVGDPPTARPDLPPVDPEAPASVLFTSGSTGTPKGVVHRHASLAIVAGQVADVSPVRAGDRVAVLFPLSFQASVPWWSAALLHGASAWIRDPAELGLDRLATELAAGGPEILAIAPGVYRSLCRALGDRAVPGVRHLSLGGDRLVATDLDRCRRHFPGADLVNRLGSSETMAMALHHVTAGDFDGVEGSPVGRALPPWHLRVVDEEGEPVDDGDVGHLEVWGGPLMIGYWRDEEMTAKVLRDGPAGRVFRTGDLVVRRPDGVHVHLGRSDRRVKVRGVTVEVAEVEAALERCEGIHEAVVAGVRGADGETALVAHVVAEGASMTLRDLRRLLRRELVDVMIPTSVRVHADLPRTERGKVDRDALAPESGVAMPLVSGRTIKHPRSADEARAAAFIAEVLDVDAVGIFDDFFELGGDSLAANELVVMVAERTGTDIPIGAFAAEPTAAALARHLGGGRRRRTSFPSVQEIRPPVDGRTLVIVPGAGSTAVSMMHLVRSVRASVGIVLVEQRGLQQPALPHRTLDAIAAHVAGAVPVEAERIAIAGYSFGAVPALVAARRLRAAGRRVDLVVSLDGPAPGTLGRRPTGLAAAGMRARQWATILRRVGPSLLRPRDDDHYMAFYRLAERAKLLHEEPSADDEVLFVQASQSTPRSEAWRRICGGGVEVVEVLGDHQAILHPPWVESVAAVLDHALRDRLGADVETADA